MPLRDRLFPRRGLGNRIMVAWTKPAGSRVGPAEVDQWQEGGVPNGI